MQALPVRAVMRTLARSVIVLLLAALTLVSSGWTRPQPSTANRLPQSQPATGGNGPLQEVAPPPAVQQLAERLAARNPHVQIVAPSDDSLLPDGPWRLQLDVSDWPLSDAGPLGLGPHVVVQLDQQPPLRISSPVDAAAITMQPLLPGSHRLTVYAARPWGEAVKSPGAVSQIRLHRVGRNAAELPARGSAQLIAASPDGLQQDDPVLIDWLLLDAPLQHLRDDDARWRLRVSVNGDSFLVDRQTPLWLKGFRRGSNAVQLELLDGRGDPLNPPFNSLVREVVIGSGSKPGWRRSTLTSAELASLSGEAAIPSALDQQPDTGPDRGAAADEAPSPGVQPAEPVREEPTATEPAVEPAMEPATPVANSKAISAEAEEVALPEGPPAAAEAMPPTADTPAPAPETQKTAAEPSEPPPAEPAPERVAPTSSLAGSARELVNADGSLVKPQRRGPLAGLREKLGA
jgi:hypothetical protein